MKLMYHYGIMCDWKAEINLRTPKWPSGLTGMGHTDFHGRARSGKGIVFSGVRRYIGSGWKIGIRRECVDYGTVCLVVKIGAKPAADCCCIECVARDSRIAVLVVDSGNC